MSHQFILISSDPPNLPTFGLTELADKKLGKGKMFRIYYCQCFESNYNISFERGALSQIEERAEKLLGHSLPKLPLILPLIKNFPCMPGHFEKEVAPQ